MPCVARRRPSLLREWSGDGGPRRDPGCTRLHAAESLGWIGTARARRSSTCGRIRSACARQSSMASRRGACVFHSTPRGTASARWFGCSTTALWLPDCSAAFPSLRTHLADLLASPLGRPRSRDDGRSPNWCVPQRADHARRVCRCAAWLPLCRDAGKRGAAGDRTSLYRRLRSVSRARSGGRRLVDGDHEPGHDPRRALLRRSAADWRSRDRRRDAWNDCRRGGSRALEGLVRAHGRGRLCPRMRRRQCASTDRCSFSPAISIRSVPPRWAEEVRTTMPRARHLIAPGLGHNVTPVGCAPELVAAFIERADAMTLDAGCLTELSRPPFVTSTAGWRP